MVRWPYTRGVQRRLIPLGKPNRNVYVASFDGRLRDDCLNAHGFTHVLHARTVIETWRRDYNEHRSKQVLGGMTPSTFAERLASAPSTPDSKPDGS